MAEVLRTISSGTFSTPNRSITTIVPKYGLASPTKSKISDSPRPLKSASYQSAPTTPSSSRARKVSALNSGPYPVTPSPPSRRSLIPASPSLHAKLLLSRLLPEEVVLSILSFAHLYHRTGFSRTRQPISYRERQVCTPHRIYQSVPPTLHLISPGHSVSGIGIHPLRLVKFYLRFCPARLPNAQVNFVARLLRDGKHLEASETPLANAAPMDGKLHSRSLVVGENSDLVRMARAGDRVGVWVVGDGGLYGDWLHIPGHIMRVLVEVREVSIECFCAW